MVVMRKISKLYKPISLCLRNITDSMDKKPEHRKNIWRRFNGDSISIPIKDAVEQAIIRETDAGFKLKVCIWYRFTGQGG